MTKQRSLASIAGWTSAAVSTAVMAVLAAMDLMRGSRANLAEHALHVLAIAAPVYVVSWFAFRRLVSEPIRRLESQLYRVATGKLEPVDVSSSIVEVRAIEHAANLMVQRMVMGSRQAPSAGPALPVELRAIAKEHNVPKH